MEQEQTIPNDLLRNVILPNVWVRTLLESCTQVCRQWNRWITPKFWETVFKAQFGKFTIQLVPPVTNLNWRRMSIEASLVPPIGTVATLNNGSTAYTVEDVIYCTHLKMKKTLTSEVLDLEPEYFRPMIKPGTNGHPALAVGIRVFGKWKKQSFWSGKLTRVDHEKKQVDIHWEDDDKGTIDFDEVYSYPNEEEVLALRKQIIENTLDPKTHVFASRTDLAKSGRCGPYHEGTMDHLSCHWSVLLSDGTMVSPTAITVRKQLTIPQVYSKIDNLIDKNLMGQRVLYKTDNSGEFHLCEVSSDPQDFASLVVQKEDQDEGLYELKVYYTVIRDKQSKHIPGDSIVRVSRPLIQDLAVGKTMYVLVNRSYVKGEILAIDGQFRALVSFYRPNSQNAVAETCLAQCADLLKPIIL